MEKDNNYTASVTAGIDTDVTTHSRSGSDQRLMLDYMQNYDPINDNTATMIAPSYHHQHQQQQQELDSNNNNNNNMYAVDRTLSFADVMQFAEHGHHNNQSTTGNDPASLLRFPVLGDQLLMQLPSVHSKNDYETNSEGMVGQGSDFGYVQSNHDQYGDNPIQLEFMENPSDENFIDNLSADDKIVVERGQVGGGGGGGTTDGKSSGSSKRKRPRTIKTTEEVESQRMTHIAVERNRRKQMNEHLRVLRSLMPSSYVQRGDQASIIGGAIEFVRELEQLLQCLESQKRRRLYGDQPSSNNLGLVQQPPQSPLGFQCPPPLLPTNQQHHNNQEVQLRLVDDHNPQLDSSTNNNLDCSTTNSTAVDVGGGSGLLLQEEMAESKSCIADVEVKVLGFDALIKILSRRRPSQLIKAIAALEDLHFTILHTNITTIEQTVLYSFNVKVGSEARFTAEDIATSVQQIFTFIHANTNIS